MPYALIGESQRGKTFFGKTLIQRLQDESQVPCDEWKPGTSNTDNTIYMKRGTLGKIYDKSKFPYKQLLQQLTRDAFSDEWKNRYKIIFIDDNTTDINNRDPLLTKIYTEGRHRGIDIIQALHYISSIYINVKAFIRDFVLFGPQIFDKTKTFYKSLMQQHFDKQDSIEQDGSEIEGYNFDKFWYQLENWMDGGLIGDDENRGKYFHRAVQIKLPTKQDPRAIIQFIEPDRQQQDIITSNGLYKLLM